MIEKLHEIKEISGKEVGGLPLVIRACVMVGIFLNRCTVTVSNQRLYGLLGYVRGTNIKQLTMYI